MNRWVFRYALMLGASLTSCAERLPTYRWVNETHAMGLMAERASRVQTLTSACRVILTDVDARSIQLDGAIVARMPGFLRLRAWKFSQPVLDVTLTPVGLWLFSAQDCDPPSALPSPFATLTAPQLRQAWSLATGVIPRDGWTWDGAHTQTSIRIRQEWEPGGSILCTIDRPTLTLRGCTVTQTSAPATFTLVLDRYRSIGDGVVPTRVVMRSQQGAITILLDDVSLNEALSPQAFDPPLRAVKQP